MLTVKVLGSGCANCKKLEQQARTAVSQTGVEAQVEKVTDYADITSYNILSTPGLVINEKLVSAGPIRSTSRVAATPRYSGKCP